MTTYVQKEDKCFVCGAVTVFSELASTNTFGSPDLDLRPAPMERWTINSWIRKCPVCGYVSTRVSDSSQVTREFLSSEEYLTCDGISFKSELAAGFYKQYKIALIDKSDGSAFHALLHAAWACDDAEDEENARFCRKTAVTFLTKMIESGSEPEDMSLLKADLLRRSGCFEQLITEYRGFTFKNPLLNELLAFEIAKAKEKDTKCYTVADAAEGPKSD